MPPRDSRLVVVSVLILWFGRTPSLNVNVVSFALAYVASFFAFLVLQVWAIQRVLNKAGSSRGEEREGASSK